MDNLLVEPNNNINEVPPLKTKSKSSSINPSSNNKARMTFSTKAGSAF